MIKLCGYIISDGDDPRDFFPTNCILVEDFPSVVDLRLYCCFSGFPRNHEKHGFSYLFLAPTGEIMAEGSEKYETIHDDDRVPPEYLGMAVSIGVVEIPVLGPGTYTFIPLVDGKRVGSVPIPIVQVLPEGQEQSRDEYEREDTSDSRMDDRSFEILQ